MEVHHIARERLKGGIDLVGRLKVGIDLGRLMEVRHIALEHQMGDIALARLKVGIALVALQREDIGLEGHHTDQMEGHRIVLVALQKEDIGLEGHRIVLAVALMRFQRLV